MSLKIVDTGLNPYFNGIYFLISNFALGGVIKNTVLILILMEYTF